MDFEEVTFKPDSGVIDKDKDPKRTHLSDALGYLIWQEYRPAAAFGEQSEPADLADDDEQEAATVSTSITSIRTIANKRAMWRQYRDLYAGGEQFKVNADRYLVRRQKEPGDVYAERLEPQLLRELHRLDCRLVHRNAFSPRAGIGV